MSVEIERRRGAGRLGRKGLSAIMGVVVMAAVVVAVGVAGYMTLSAVGHSSSSTQHSCAPAGSPQCTAKAHASSDVGVPRLALVGAAAG